MQISSLTGWVDPDKMRPLNSTQTPARWDSCGIRKSPGWEQQMKKHGQCAPVNLTSSGNGTGTYRAGLYDLTSRTPGWSVHGVPDCFVYFLTYFSRFAARWPTLAGLVPICP